jgi:tryptophan halogenase
MIDRAIRSIVIAGGGIVGLSAALAFQRSLPRTSITVVETAVDPAALADRMPTAWPTISRFHALIGLDELDLVRSGIAVHHVGTLFEAWGANEGSWVHAFAPHGRPIGPVPFDQIWLQAHELGRAKAFDAYSMGAALARAGKFVHPSSEPDSLASRFIYGLRFDPDFYRARLADVAASRGVQLVAGKVLGLDRREDGGINGLRLSDDRLLEADLFVDCTGPAASLIGEVDDSFDEWPSHLATKVKIGSRPSESPSPTARIRATDDGWTGEWPLRDRVITCTAGPNGCVSVRPGRRLRPWSRNVLALGEAATAVDPIAGFNLDLAHRAILLALELLPGRDFSPLETAEFNRRAALITQQAGDFTALLHARTSPQVSDSVARLLDQYQYRGRLPFREEETLNRDHWTSAFLGLGLVPANIDPAARNIPLDRAVEAMEKLADEAAAFAERAPAYEDYLRRIAG